MKKLLGANWPTTLWGGLFVLALYITQNPAALAAVIPEDSAKTIGSWASLVTGLVAFYRAKDKAVSGNGTLADPTRVAPGPLSRHE